MGYYERKRSPVIAPLLVTINVMVFVYQIYLQFQFGPSAFQSFNEEYWLVPSVVLRGQDLYRLVSHMFLHGSLIHLLLNCIPLYFFGSYLEADIGSLKFGGMYFLSGIAGGITYVIVRVAEAPNIPVIGASAAIFGIVGTVTLIHPLKFGWSLFAPFPIVVFTASYVLVATLLVTTGYVSHIAHSAHLGGLVAGMVYAFCLRPKEATQGFLIFMLVLVAIFFLITAMIEF
ncbi:MAG: rhomboid family intramembrane serine protease [Candidatus Bathyarchaeia archaeon]